MTQDVSLLRLVLSTGRVDLSTARVLIGNPVKLAVENGDHSLLTTFLDMGADPNGGMSDDPAMHSPLGAAVRLKRAGMVLLLLERGADPNGQCGNPARNSPLGAAVRLKRADMVQLLLERGADPNGQRGSRHMDSPLGAAVRLKQADMVQLLLERGADPNRRMSDDPAMQSPLDAAVRLKRADMVQLLLERGADPNIGQPYYCLLEEAVMRGSLDIALQLLLAGANVRGDMQTLHDAARWESVGFARLLLQMGADINHQDEFGLTLLHCAETLEICEFLIDRGADLNIRDNDGRTPIFSLDYAKVQLLLRRGAEVNIKDIDGRTPLMWVLYMHELQFTTDSPTELIQLLFDSQQGM